MFLYPNGVVIPVVVVDLPSHRHRSHTVRRDRNNPHSKEWFRCQSECVRGGWISAEVELREVEDVLCFVVLLFEDVCGILLLG